MAKKVDFIDKKIEEINALLRGMIKQLKNSNVTSDYVKEEKCTKTQALSTWSYTNIFTKNE